MSLRQKMMALVVGVAALAAGCGDDAAEITTTTAPPATTTAPPTTTTAPPTTTTAPPTTTTAPPTTTTAPPATTTAPPTTTTTLAPDPFDPLEVTLVFEIDGSSGVAAGTFTASGPAVDAGVMCPSGTSFESSFEASGRTEMWTTRCTCDDGSGRFSVDVTAVGEWEGGVAGSTWLFTGTWTLDEGSDAYAAMMGEGANEGRCPGPDFDCTVPHAGTVWRDG